MLTGKETASLKMVLFKLDDFTCKNASRSIIITQHTTQALMDQESQHKTRYTQSDRRELRK